MFERIENLKPVSVVRGRASLHRLYQNRPMHALVFKLCGESLYHCRGKSIRHTPGDLLFIPKGENYTVTLLTPPPSEYLLINFEGEIGWARMKKYELSNGTDVSHLCTRILKLRSFESEADCCRCRAILYELFSMMLDLEAGVGEREPGEGAIEEAVRYLQEHLFSPSLKIGDLHEMLGVSAPFFRNQFVARFGVSPKKYVINKRMTQARAILENGEYNSIAEVAALVGFEDALYFGKLFRQTYGVSPSKIRK